MSTTTTPPVISFQNTLAYDITVYDSFDDEPQADDGSETDADSNYFGTLTKLGIVSANSTASIQPIHTTSTFIVESAAESKPVKRCIKLGSKKTLTSFTIAQQDEDSMTKTFQFIDFILHNPNDPVTTSFNEFWKKNDPGLAPDVDDFFSKQPAYSQCTFEDYMMGITYKAKHPDPVPKPVQETTYSLSQLITLMGGSWPAGMPDIIVSHFTFSNRNSVLDIGIQVDITELPFETPEIAQNIRTLFQHTDTKVTAKLQINYGISLGIFGTRISFLLETLKIPVGGGNVLAVTQPSITIDINPLFKFVALTVRGIIPFSIFSKQFNANISMVIDNMEAEIGAVIEGDKSSLPAPPVMKGVHFDEFGVGIGIFFTPPSIAIGLQGKFHIGEPGGGNVVDLNDDTFAVVCAVEGGEVPDPLYASFYVPKMDLNKAVELFTNANPNLDVPLTFTDMSFKWAENPMEPVVLPDGTLSEMAYGFSAAINVFSFGFYGDVEIDMNNGLTALVECSPVSLGEVLTLSGDGKGVTIKVDQNGNPIRNNEIRDKQVLQDALKNARDKQLVAPGGPVLQINTFKSPILHVNGKVSLFELMNYGIEADINKDGILFMLDFGGILTEQMTCRLSDFHNFYGSFKFGINREFALPTIGGARLGSVHVEAEASVHISIQTSLSDITLSIGGSFDFEGNTRRFGDFSADIHIKKMTDVIGAVLSNIEQFAEQIFDDIIHDVQKYAEVVKDGLMRGGSYVGDVFKNAFNKTASEASALMKDVGCYVDFIGSQLKDVYNADSIAVASILKNLGYSANEVGTAIKNTWNCGLNDVTYAMKAVGYTAEEVSNSLRNAFGSVAQDVTNSLKAMGYVADDIARNLKDTFNADSIAVASIMKNAGYAANEIAGGIKNAWNCGETDVAYAMKAVGYSAQEVAGGLQYAFNSTIDGAASALKQVGYAAQDVASGVKNAYNVSVDAVAAAMKDVGYAADTVSAAFQSLGGDFEDFANKAWNKVTDPDTYNPTKW